ncbi:hypothetical protein [Caldisericum sp.]|uniref:hypothetical protein n=1 Tax=Caldisericum sp. TaxID=2499687 RepID=UPI003D1143D9
MVLIIKKSENKYNVWVFEYNKELDLTYIGSFFTSEITITKDKHGNLHFFAKGDNGIHLSPKEIFLEINDEIKL